MNYLRGIEVWQKRAMFLQSLVKLLQQLSVQEESMLRAPVHSKNNNNYQRWT